MSLTPNRPPVPLTAPGVGSVSDGGGVFAGVTDFAISLMETLGGPGAAIAIALENLFPPIPSEVVLPLAGFTVSQGDLSFVGVILWTVLGSVVGALALYGLGAWLGINRLRRVAERLPLMDASDIDATERWFHRHGTKAVFFGRMLPVFRSLISIPAGIERMRLPVFLGLTAAGSAIWNTVLVSAGYLLGEQWHVVERYTGVLQWLVAAGVALFVGWFVWSRTGGRARARRERRAAESPED
ncbi:DedA family protein [Georgenia sp. H159]|uniref:DedA family protein n=1 Tax=Georgenia sp. H159 TaxID=3076115 RepID=UPI002D798281|nr:DedA family protein [Georgenia sp. H159]